MKKHAVLSGTPLLMLSALLSVVLCAIFRIVLVNIAGADGMAYFQIAFPICALMIVFASTGLPASVAHMVSARIAKGDRRNVQTIFYLALISFAAVGLIVTVALWLLSPTIAKAVGIGKAASVLQWATPMVFICCILAAFRGYFQGLSLTAPSALSQVLGQIVKVVLGLLLAYLWHEGGPEKTALGAVLGIVIGEIVTLLFMAVMYMLGIDQMQEVKGPLAKTRIKSKGKVIARLWQKGLVLSVGQAAIPLILLLDAFHGMRLVGAQSDAALMAVPGQFGLYAGVAFPMALGMCMLISAFVFYGAPRIMKYIVRQEYNALRRSIESNLRIAFSFGLGAAVLLFLLAEPLMTLLFSAAFDEGQIAYAASLLRIMSFGTLFACVAQSAVSILQNAGREIIALISVLFAFLIKFILMQILVRMDNIGFFTLPFSSVMALFVIALIATAYVLQFARLKTNWWMFMPKAAIAAALTGACVYLLYHFALLKPLGVKIAGLVCLLVGLIVFLLAAVLLNLVKGRELAQLPLIGGFFGPRSQEHEQ